MRSDAEVNRAIDLYADTVRRICFYHLQNHADTDDIFQTVFVRYLLDETPFADDTHEKAWLIRVTVNACKDHKKSLFRRRAVPLEVLAEEAASVTPQQSEILEALLALPAKYKDPLYLHYYEGYSAAEIGHMLSAKENTVYSLLSRGRRLLKEKLGGDLFDEPAS